MTREELREKVAWIIAGECRCAMGCKGAIDHYTEADAAIDHLLSLVEAVVLVQYINDQSVDGTKAADAILKRVREMRGAAATAIRVLGVEKS